MFFFFRFFATLLLIAAPNTFPPDRDEYVSCSHPHYFAEHKNPYIIGAPARGSLALFLALLGKLYPDHPVFAASQWFASCSVASVFLFTRSSEDSGR